MLFVAGASGATLQEVLQGRLNNFGRAVGAYDKKMVARLGESDFDPEFRAYGYGPYGPGKGTTFQTWSRGIRFYPSPVVSIRSLKIKLDSVKPNGTTAWGAASCVTTFSYFSRKPSTPDGKIEIVAKWSLMYVLRKGRWVIKEVHIREASEYWDGKLKSKSGI